MLEAIDDGLAEPDEYLPALRDQVRQLTGLVDDLFELARIDAGDLTLELARDDARRVVETASAGLTAEARARARPSPRRARPAAADRPLRAGARSSACSSTSSRTRCATPRTDGSIAVLVHPAEHDGRGRGRGHRRRPERRGAARMFERFWRADTARSSRGSGLGLAIARGLVEAQGGRIWAENRPQGGTRVAFTLPAAPA